MKEVTKRTWRIRKAKQSGGDVLMAKSILFAGEKVHGEVGKQRYFGCDADSVEDWKSVVNEKIPRQGEASQYLC